MWSATPSRTQTHQATTMATLVTIWIRKTLMPTFCIHLVGHAPEFIPLREDDLVVSNVPYRLGDYRLQGFHIHYGGDIGGENAGVRTSHGGSEHAVNGVRFDGELHVVLINRKYQDIRDAETRTDGLVVLVFFIKTAPSTTDPRAAEFSQFLETNIPVIANHDVNVSVAINLGMFLDRQCDFYTYAGSLTTPLCHESVRWVIFEEPLTVTETAWQTLAGLQGHGAHGNCRGIQPLNDRLIKANFQPQRTTTTQAPVRERYFVILTY
ncbi:CAH3-like protein [Mya arenaria]|uniref:Carbonic anhydrase n=1 Tax=Mya arenaria TaxID=6604 RepID=A0ABY7E3U5_MYAAR|nr:CAH3-like protein [Mya arenaria]